MYIFCLIQACFLSGSCKSATKHSQEPGANAWNGWKLVKVNPPPKWAGVAAANARSFAINEKGELYGWGSNVQGRLGDGTTTNRNSPTRIGTAADWAHIAAGYHSLAINTKGELYAWGYNSVGQLGDGTSTDKSSPVKIAHP